MSFAKIEGLTEKVRNKSFLIFAREDTDRLHLRFEFDPVEFIVHDKTLKTSRIDSTANLAFGQMFDAAQELRDTILEILMEYKKQKNV